MQSAWGVMGSSTTNASAPQTFNGGIKKRRSSGSLGSKHAMSVDKMQVDAMDINAVATLARAKLQASSTIQQQNPAASNATSSMTTVVMTDTAANTTFPAKKYPSMPLITPGGSSVISAGNMYPIQNARNRNLSKTRKFKSERYVILVVDGKNPIYIPKLDLTFRSNVRRPTHHLHQAPQLNANEQARLLVAAQQLQQQRAMLQQQMNVQQQQQPSVSFVPAHAGWSANHHSPPPPSSGASSATSSSSSHAMSATRGHGLWANIKAAFTPPHHNHHGARPAWR
mmetsp:Transcript_15889/g.40382  ORF Transcript_15889/g.40382 Transcript_15889/m.40382 type:complete len:283 (-) Transcript_15889:553-1401(-)